LLPFHSSDKITTEEVYQLVAVIGAGFVKDIAQMGLYRLFRYTQPLCEFLVGFSGSAEHFKDFQFPRGEGDGGDIDRLLLIFAELLFHRDQAVAVLIDNGEMAIQLFTVEEVRDPEEAQQEENDEGSPHQVIGSPGRVFRYRSIEDDEDDAAASLENAVAESEKDGDNHHSDIVLATAFFENPHSAEEHHDPELDKAVYAAEMKGCLFPPQFEDNGFSGGK